VTDFPNDSVQRTEQGIALKGARAPRHSRMVSGYSSTRLDWMIKNGLAWRGLRPADWKPKPATLSAWLFYIFVMVPRSI
jgi:hypothetical protein